MTVVKSEALKSGQASQSSSDRELESSGRESPSSSAAVTAIEEWCTGVGSSATDSLLSPTEAAAVQAATAAGEDGAEEEGTTAVRVPGGRSVREGKSLTRPPENPETEEKGGQQGLW